VAAFKPKFQVTLGLFSLMLSPGFTHTFGAMYLSWHTSSISFLAQPKLKTRRFKIELATDDEIRNAAPGSTLLVDAFHYVDEGKNDLLSRSER